MSYNLNTGKQRARGIYRKAESSPCDFFIVLRFTKFQGKRGNN